MRPAIAALAQLGAHDSRHESPSPRGAASSSFRRRRPWLLVVSVIAGPVYQLCRAMPAGFLCRECAVPVRRRLGRLSWA